MTTTSRSLSLRCGYAFNVSKRITPNSVPSSVTSGRLHSFPNTAFTTRQYSMLNNHHDKENAAYPKSCWFPARIQLTQTAQIRHVSTDNTLSGTIIDVLYDGECPLCVHEITWLRRRNQVAFLMS
jgi:hypothetical protein